ncbi:aldo/keto reductase [Enterococcus faecalis]|nr:aldo/keto reductase [Enterococcus faecalis]
MGTKKINFFRFMYLTLRFRIEHVKKLEEENNMQTITLNNGVEMPQLGFGVYQIPLEETAEAVYQAIKAGYRLIDTASIYGNEKETGEGIKRAINEDLVTRDELFITSKLFILQASEDKAKETIEHSLKVMELDYLDLYLIHQPYGDIYGAWRSMVATQKVGKLRAIGISNFKSAKMIEFVGLNEVKPQINQIEVNPWNQRIEDQEWHEKYEVQIEAWAPFAEGRHELFTNPVLTEIGKQYGKTVGQVVLRWLMQRGIVALAKSIHPERMAENIDIFDFELSKEDIEKIANLDMKESAFFDHDAPQQVEWFMNRMLDTEINVD